jgi:hypothetical protein
MCERWGCYEHGDSFQRVEATFVHGCMVDGHGDVFKTKIETKPKSLKMVDQVHANALEGGC